MANKPMYPIYIISKGRYDITLTANNLINSNLEYYIAVEPHESEMYIKKLGKERVLILPFKNLGLGSYPARNFCWDHAIKNGHKKHWLLDDNIQYWCKWIDGKRKKIYDITNAFKYVENFSNKYNIDIAGFEEPNFVVKPPKKDFKINCHVYSAMLIKNSIKYRWRLKYNEDVDLCLQVLHNNGTTASCVYYMADKVSTAQKMKGGNQEELYKGNDPKKKLLKAKMLESVWPQYAKTVIRFNRYHHLVNWKIFKKNLSKLN